MITYVTKDLCRLKNHQKLALRSDRDRKKKQWSTISRWTHDFVAVVAKSFHLGHSLPDLNEINTSPIARDWLRTKNRLGFGYRVRTRSSYTFQSIYILFYILLYTYIFILYTSIYLYIYSIYSYILIYFLYILFNQYPWECIAFSYFLSTKTENCLIIWTKDCKEQEEYLFNKTENTKYFSVILKRKKDYLLFSCSFLRSWIRASLLERVYHVLNTFVGPVEKVDRAERREPASRSRSTEIKQKMPACDHAKRASKMAVKGVPLKITRFDGLGERRLSGIKAWHEWRRSCSVSSTRHTDDVRTWK